ncbi:MAG: copper amine oxidase N-terminal domain-containing protein [Clostridiales bacterium]|jgi:hypothetical protein|nr:copper amine oxidase N-terminal domain-containing protein [Clostridiales bacterium]
MIKKIIMYLTVLSMSSGLSADGLKITDGVIVESGNLITVQTTSVTAPFLTFDAGVARIEMTTGLAYAGELTMGQTVRLVYRGEPEGGFVQAEYLLFNPDYPEAADIETCLRDNGGKGFLSDGDRYLLFYDPDTEITDSLGRKAEMRAGQYILGWLRETASGQPQIAILKRAVVINLAEEVRADKQIIVTDSGDVLLDDGPIAKLDEFQAEYCRLNHMAPVRPIAEALGYTVEWEPNRTVRVQNEKYSFNFNIGDEFYQVNGKFVYFSGNCFIIFMNRAFADYSVINALVN